jgi:hypothetical protein
MLKIRLVFIPFSLATLFFFAGCGNLFNEECSCSSATLGVGIQIKESEDIFTADSISYSIDGGEYVSVLGSKVFSESGNIDFIVWHNGLQSDTLSFFAPEIKDRCAARKTHYFNFIEEESSLELIDSGVNEQCG